MLRNIWSIVKRNTEKEQYPWVLRIMLLKSEADLVDLEGKKDEKQTKS